MKASVPDDTSKLIGNSWDVGEEDVLTFFNLVDGVTVNVVVVIVSVVSIVIVIDVGTREMGEEMGGKVFLVNDGRRRAGRPTRSQGGLRAGRGRDSGGR